MKIAITSTGTKPDSEVDRRFGRCAFFSIYDMANLEFSSFPNPHRDQMEGAGPSAVKFIADHHVKVVASGDFGGKAKILLDRLNIDTVMVGDDMKTVQDVFEKIKREIQEKSQKSQ